MSQPNRHVQILMDEDDEDNASLAVLRSERFETDNLEIGVPISTIHKQNFVAVEMSDKSADHHSPSVGSRPNSTGSKVAPHDGAASGNMEEEVAFLALHLTCTPEFHDAMLKVPASLSLSTINSEWLCNIAFPTHLGRGQNDLAWARYCQQRVLSSAEAIYYQLPKDVLAPDWNKVKSPVPLFNMELNGLREDLFRYHELRLGIFDASKVCEEIHTRNIRLDVPFDKMDVLEDRERVAAQGCQDALRNTNLETDVSAHIDNLLKTFEERSRPALSYPGRGLHTYHHAISWIKETYNFTPQYIQPREDLRPLVFQNAFEPKRRAAAQLDDPSPSKRIPISNAQWSYGTLADHDARLKKLVHLVFTDLDHELFERNLQAFLNTKTRLPHIESLSNQFIKRVYTSEKSSRIKPDEIDPRDLLQDNLVHANALFHRLKKERGKQYDSPMVSKIWHRLMSIVALCYGCISEPALLLTTMDRCLGELRDAFGCQIGTDVSLGAAAAFEEEVQKLGQIDLSTAISLQEKGGYSRASETYLCHIVITELAIFVRACVMEAAAITGHRVRLSPKEKYEKLLGWKDTCGVCKKPLTLPENFTRTISVGTRDARVGNPVARLETSSNRASAYVCLSALCSTNFFLNCEILFWYFAHMYHRVCKPYREKNTALD